MSHDHTFVSGEVLTAANINDLTSGRVAYVAVTADQTGITTATVDLTSLTATFTAIASRYYRVTGSYGQLTGTAGATNRFNLIVANGSNTQLALSIGPVIAAGGVGMGNTVTYVVAPGAGSVTYKLRAITDTGTMTMNASASSPAFILVEDIGSS